MEVLEEYWTSVQKRPFLFEKKPQTNKTNNKTPKNPKHFEAKQGLWGNVGVRSVGKLRLEVEATWSNPLLKVGSSVKGCSGFCADEPWTFSRLQGWRFHNISGLLLQYLTTLWKKKIFSLCSWNFHCCPLIVTRCLFAVCLQEVWLSLLYIFSRGICRLQYHPLELPFLRAEQTHLPQSLPICYMLQSPTVLLALC